MRQIVFLLTFISFLLAQPNSLHGLANDSANIVTKILGNEFDEPHTIFLVVRYAFLSSSLHACLGQCWNALRRCQKTRSHESNLSKLNRSL
uniref:Secreted protein n=1 Tax=Caenorhabditis tropicalis TaxID=1561998 RepID=A0A1I7UI05_9PELO